MKLALLRFPFGYLLGLVDDEQAGLVMATPSDDEDTPPPQILLRYPAEPQPQILMTQAKIEQPTLGGPTAATIPQGVCFPVWLGVKLLRVFVEEALAGEVFALDSDDALLVMYLRSLATAGVNLTETGQTRVKLGRT